jgi:hypothetical protein
MRSLLVLFGVVLLGVCADSCGETAKTSSSTSDASSATTASATATSPAGYLNDGDKDVIGDYDSDNNHDDDNDSSEDYKPDDNGDYHDSDDGSVTNFGQPADVADSRAITAVVERYYALARAKDGHGACAILLPTLAGAMVEDYGHGSAGPAYLSSGTTCPAVLKLLFEHFRGQLDVAVTGVRLSGDGAQALLGSRTARASSIYVRRQGGTWRIGWLLGEALP